MPKVGRKSPYPEEFRKNAVALYRASAGKCTGDAAHVGPQGHQPVRARTAGGAPCPVGPRGWPVCGPRTRRLPKAEKKWRLEREILRRAAACFARAVK